MSNIIKPEIQVKNLELFYGDNKALKNINLDIESKKVTALIFPSINIWPLIFTPSIKSFILFKVLKNVDLPHPEGPINAVTFFDSISKFIFFNALLSP